MTGDATLLVEALAGYAGAHFSQGRLEESIQTTEEVLALAERVGDLQQVSSALGQLAWYKSAILGKFAESRAYRDRALDLGERLEDPRLLFVHLRSRGRLNFLNGDWRSARADCERARALHPWPSELSVTCFPLLILGQVSLAQGQWAEATQLLEEGVAVAERTHFLNGQRIGQATLAERDLLEGRALMARARLVPLLGKAGLVGDLDLVALLPLLAWAALLLGKESQAEALAHQAVVQAQQMRSLLPDALRLQGLVHIKRQRWDEAREVLEEALVLCQAMPYPYAEAKALYVYGLLHHANGEPIQARVRLEAALEILNRLGERLYAEQVERALAECKRP
jgi:tetratricopeptide (TPR) repeat protein